MGKIITLTKDTVYKLFNLKNHIEDIYSIVFLYNLALVTCTISMYNMYTPEILISSYVKSILTTPTPHKIDDLYSDYLNLETTLTPLKVVIF